jgi:hypothetical protein
MPSLTTKQKTIAILLLALSVRLLLLLLFVTDNVDVQNYRRVAEIVEEHGIEGLYVQTPSIYPYPSVWAWAEWLSGRLAEVTGGSYSFWIRLPIVLADVLIVAILLAWPGAPATRGLAYALNPIALLVTCFHGQFDAIAISFLLLAAFMLLCRKRVASSGWALAVAIAVKSFPVLMLPFLALSVEGRRRRLWLSSLALLPLLLLLLPFALRTPSALSQELFGYRGAALLGFMVPLRTLYVPLMDASFPLDTTIQLLRLSTYLFLGAYLVYILWVWRRGVRLLLDIVVVFALFYVLYAGIAPQYVLWVLPFLLLIDMRPAMLYTATGTLALVGFYLYAVPNTLVFWEHAPRLFVQALYGVGGTLWWLTAVLVLFWGLRRQSQ